MTQTATKGFATLRPGPLRPDLQSSDQTQRGRRYAVIKSPLTLTYFRLPAEHYEAAKEFDGKRPLQEISTSLRAHHPYWRTLTQEDALSELVQLANQLATGGLLRLAGVGATARARRLQAHANSRKLEKIVGKVLYFRKALIDPDKLLARILPWFAWAYTRTAGCFFLLLIAATAWMLLENGEELTAQAVNFFTLENLFLSWVLFMGVKIIHEFGHGLTCKRYGGEVHEMGFLFILLTPYLYCDVSDSWMVASRARRVAVTAAGMVAELFMACIAAWLWHILQPGLGRQICLNTMIICSISTILFNANPLMKFDGYYIVTDLLEIPNLRQKGNSVVAGFFLRLLGMPDTRAAVSEHEKGALFGIYAIAAYVYGWWITFHIAAVVFDKLEPYGLEFLSRSYVALFLFVSVALPLWRLVGSLRAANPAKMLFRSPRFGWVILVGCLLTLILFIPVRQSIHAMCVVEYSSREQITPNSPGWLKQWFIHEGSHVETGQILAKLENPALEDAVKEAMLGKEAANVQWRAALESQDESIRLTAPALEKSALEIDEQLHSLEGQFSRLTVRATAPGVVVQPDLEHDLGQYFPVGRLLLQIGDDRAFQVILPLDEKQARQVRQGDEVSLQLRAYPDKKINGHITTIPTAASEAFSTPLMASALGGEFPSESAKKTGEMPRPAIPCYEVLVRLDTIAEPLRPGMMGRASIVTGTADLGGWLAQQVFDWLNPALRL